MLSNSLSRCRHRLRANAGQRGRRRRRDREQPHARYTRTERVVELSTHLATTEHTTTEAIVARWETEIPMRRLAEPHEFAALAASSPPNGLPTSPAIHRPVAAMDFQKG